ncbi:MAG: hypothetical protein ABH828_00440 [archaeon]
MNKKGKIVTIVAIVLVAILVMSLALAKPTKVPTPKPECSDKIDNDGDGLNDLADPGCDSRQDTDESNCGDGVCEGTEACDVCVADCGTCDSCSDTDGGINVMVQGIVSGYNNGFPYSKTDFCIGNSTTEVVIEYYCNDNQWESYQYDCAGNQTTTCSNGACI